jgi:hypothetical protein
MRLGIGTGAVEGTGPNAFLKSAGVRTSLLRTSASIGAAGIGERARSAFAPRRHAPTHLSPLFVEREGIRPSDGRPRLQSRGFSGHE